VLLLLAIIANLKITRLAPILDVRAPLSQRNVEDLLHACAAMNFSNCARDNLRRNTTDPSAPAPCA
jgi:hypothetical protein